MFGLILSLTPGFYCCPFLIYFQLNSTWVRKCSLSDFSLWCFSNVFNGPVYSEIVWMSHEDVRFQTHSLGCKNESEQMIHTQWKSHTHPGWGHVCSISYWQSQFKCLKKKTSAFVYFSFDRRWLYMLCITVSRCIHVRNCFILLVSWPAIVTTIFLFVFSIYVLFTSPLILWLHSFFFG